MVQWLQPTHKQQEVFVANITASILENFSMDKVKQVKGVKNPAEIRTRGS